MLENLTWFILASLFSEDLSEEYLKQRGEEGIVLKGVEIYHLEKHDPEKELRP